MTGTEPVAFTPSITLLCPPALRSRLLLRLANWSGAATGTIDPDIDIHTPDRARHGRETYTIASVPVPLFTRYGPLPFTGEGEHIDPRRASIAYIITPADFDAAAPGRSSGSSTNS